MALSTLLALGAATVAPWPEAGAAPSGRMGSTTVRVMRLERVGDRLEVVRRTARVDTLYLAAGRTGASRAAGLQRAGVPAGYEIDHRVRLQGTVARRGPMRSDPMRSDPMRPDQWGLKAIRAPRVWHESRGRKITVAVIDSGVRADHEDLAGAVEPGLDLVSESGGDGTTDPNGHGTHVAAIIGARAGNGIGVAGAAPSVRILPIRVLDENGSGYTSDVAEGIIYAADHGARVINLSLGGPDPSPVMQDAIRYANSMGSVVVVAAGNDAMAGNPTMYPASYPEAIAVGAVDADLTRADFSVFGDWVDLTAPGVDVLSAWSSRRSAYAYATGTSMATPYVAAVAALMFAADPSLTPAAVQRRMMRTAFDLGPKGVDAEFGAGMVRPPRAVHVPEPTTAAASRPGGRRHRAQGVRSLLG